MQFIHQNHIVILNVFELVNENPLKLLSFLLKSVFLSSQKSILSIFGLINFEDQLKYFLKFTRQRLINLVLIYTYNKLPTFLQLLNLSLTFFQIILNQNVILYSLLDLVGNIVLNNIDFSLFYLGIIDLLFNQIDFLL